MPIVRPALLLYFQRQLFNVAEIAEEVVAFHNMEIADLKISNSIYNSGTGSRICEEHLTWGIRLEPLSYVSRLQPAIWALVWYIERRRLPSKVTVVGDENCFVFDSKALPDRTKLETSNECQHCHGKPNCSGLS